MTSALDVSRLPAPTFVHPYDWEGDIAAFVADLKDRLPEWRGVFESEPFQKVCQSWAWRLALKDAQHNRDARAMLLAYATGVDLDHIASTYFRTPRPVIRPATATTPAVLMGDDEYRALAQLQPESTADFGLPRDGYVYLVRRFFATAVKDADAIRREGGRVELRLLGREGDGRVDAELLAAVRQAFAPEDKRGLTDVFQVRAAEIEILRVQVTLVIGRGPSPAAVEAEAARSLAAFQATLHRLGKTVWREAIQTAAHVGSVQTVRVTGIDEVVPGRREAAPYLVVDDISCEVVS